MQLKRFSKSLFQSVGLVVAVGQTAPAEGLRLYQLSAEAQMRADAVIASVSDAAAAWYNPAALTQMGEGNLSLNFDNLILNSAYTDTTGRKEKNEQSYFPIPSLYYGARGRQGPWAFGLAVNTPFGLATEYSKTSSFRYITTGGEVNLLSVNPSVAYEVSKELSVAAGVVYYYSTAKLTQQVNYDQFVPGTPDGGVVVEGTGDGFGMNAALHWRMTDKNTLGLTYRSQVVVDYKGEDATFTDVPFFVAGGPTIRRSAKTTLRHPDMANVGVSHRFQKGVVEVSAGWTNYTDAKDVVVNIDQNPDSVTPLNWRNTWSARVGGEYWLDDAWSLSGGYFFDKSPTRESTYSPLVPDGDHHVFCTGLTHRRGSLTWRLPLVLLVQTGTDHIDSDVTDGINQVDGKYTLTGLEIGLGASYAFGGN